MKPGDIVNGKITNILGYGAFVVVGDYDGLVHISEFSDNYVKNINDFVKVGQELRLKVLEVDEENHRIKLSYKQLHKTRGIKCKIPEYKIDFEPLAQKLPEWIEEYKEDKNEYEDSSYYINNLFCFNFNRMHKEEYYERLSIA